MQLEDLNTFITTLEKKETIGANLSKFSPDFQTAEEHKDADGLLESIG